MSNITSSFSARVGDVDIINMWELVDRKMLELHVYAGSCLSGN